MMADDTHELAIEIGSYGLAGSPKVPYGCGARKVEMLHDPVKEHVANMVRNFYFTRVSAEELAHFERASSRVRENAAKTARYAHDLEFAGRQLGLALNMPTGVTPPYLPIDVAAGPSLAFLAVAAAALTSGASRPASGRRRSLRPACERRRRWHPRRGGHSFL
mmetsp:Transcript_65064/g.188661  ORF Transcript_65064/g.188661 Transcript_65064/m.188661 type:complete len:163 (-) Transcript_65064:47-535(-)